MLDLKTLVDIRRVLTDYLTAWHTDGGFEELLELTKKVNSAIIETRANEKESDAPKEKPKETRSSLDRLCTDNYNLIVKDENDNPIIFRTNNLKRLLEILEHNRKMFEEHYKYFIVKSKNGETTKFVAYSVSELICDIKDCINTYLDSEDEKC